MNTPGAAAAAFLALELEYIAKVQTLNQEDEGYEANLEAMLVSYRAARQLLAEQYPGVPLPKATPCWAWAVAQNVPRPVPREGESMRLGQVVRVKAGHPMVGLGRGTVQFIGTNGKVLVAFTLYRELWFQADDLEPESEEVAHA